MWQAATFNSATIDRELGWAEAIGFNTMRVFLHSGAWQQDPAGFKKRLGDYLVLADKHYIQTILQAKTENRAPALLHSVSPKRLPLGRMGVPVFFSGYLSTERQCNHTRADLHARA